MVSEMPLPNVRFLKLHREHSDLIFHCLYNNAGILTRQYCPTPQRKELSYVIIELNNHIFQANLLHKH